LPQQIHAKVLPPIADETALEAQRRSVQQGVIIEEAWALYKANETDYPIYRVIMPIRFVSFGRSCTGINGSDRACLAQAHLPPLPSNEVSVGLLAVSPRWTNLKLSQGFWRQRRSFRGEGALPRQAETKLPWFSNNRCSESELRRGVDSTARR
jgi:hypothetical protein